MALISLLKGSPPCHRYMRASSIGWRRWPRRLGLARCWIGGCRAVTLANAEFLTHCQLAALGAGHLLWEGATDTFGQLLDEWIDEHNPTPRRLPMTSTTTSDSVSSTPAATQVALRLEVVMLPVADVDQAKSSYAGPGWGQDADLTLDENDRVVPFTPPGSPASVIFGTGVTAMAPGSALLTFRKSESKPRRSPPPRGGWSNSGHSSTPRRTLPRVDRSGSSPLSAPTDLWGCGRPGILR